MATDSLIFPCPACGIRLSVPVDMAGISGPCPSCWVQIQSPRANDPPAAAEPRAAVPAAGEVESLQELDEVSSGEMESGGVELPGLVDAAAPGVSRPVARPLPQRTAPEEIVIEPETRIGSMWNALPPPLARPSRKTILRLRFLLAVLCVSGAAALAYFVAR